MERASQTRTSPSANPGGDAGPDFSGRTLGDFHITRRLGAGGMGSVYLAEQISLQRKVALKFLRQDLAANAASLARFNAEALAVAKATHANIVQVYATGTAEGLPYIALEYVEGRNLREYLARKGPPEAPLAVSILRQIAAALTRAGELGIIHRDIKPDNILLTRKGEVKVADFGLSRCLNPEGPAVNLTQSGVTMGTPLYMSPEQVEGKTLDCRTDIYSLGVTAYHMLAGEPPFRGATSFEVALQHVRATAAPLAEFRPDLPPALCELIHRMMAKDPAERPQTGRELLKEVLRIREGLTGGGSIRNVLGASVELVHPSSVEFVTVRSEAALRSGGRRRWLRPVLLGLSAPAALFLGVLLAQARRSPSFSPATQPGAQAEIDETLPLPNDEPALRRTAEKYLLADKNHQKPEVAVQLGLELGLLYLEQHRLDEADRFFLPLEDPSTPRPYQALAFYLRGIVQALRNQPERSFFLFERARTASGAVDAATKAVENPYRLDPRLTPLFQNAQFVFWLSEALRFNKANAPNRAAPEWLEVYRDPKNRLKPRPPAEPAHK